MQDDALPKSELGLTFVDVITNGLGAMLVLFFVVVLVQGSLEWSSTPDAKTNQEKPESDPVLLLVQSTTNAFDAESAEPIWRYSGWSDTALANHRGVNWDWGPTHGLFLAHRPPAADASIEIYTLPGGGELRLEWHHGEHHWIHTLVAPPEGGWVTVWPWPGAL